MKKQETNQRMRVDGSRRSTAGGTRGTKAASMSPAKLLCFSVACIDMPQLEFGDKIVLPAKVLLELQCLKVPTPILFHIRPFASRQDSNNDTEPSGFSQYCSVQEFSAPDGHVFIPYWMMQNLHIGEGHEVVLTNVGDLPKAIYCRLQPEDVAFLDLAAEIGPKLLMESAFRRYSVLSVDETIIIDHGNTKFYVKVLELKPGKVVSLLGDVDLEMDFAAPPQAADRKHPVPSVTAAAAAASDDGRAIATAIQNPEVPQLPRVAMHQKTKNGDSIVPQAGIGRRLGDGACVADDKHHLHATTATKPAVPKENKSTSLQAAQQKIKASGSAQGVITQVVAAKADTDALAKDIKLAQREFSVAGQRLGGAKETTDSGDKTVEKKAMGVPSTAHSPSPPVDPSAVLCPLCLSDVSLANMELHTMRCAKNPSYHKTQCTICHEKVLKRELENHLHCPQCEQLANGKIELAAHVERSHSRNHPCSDCGAQFTHAELKIHQEKGCPQALQLCPLCGFKVKKKDMATHTQACASRTERCEVCFKFIKIANMDQHVSVCVTTPDPPATATKHPAVHTVSNQADASPAVARMECGYCSKQGFVSATQLNRHVSQECVIARSFQASLATTIATDGSTSHITALVQGKLRRRADANQLRESVSRLPSDSSTVINHGSTNQRDSGSTATWDPLVRSYGVKIKPTGTPTNITGGSRVRAKPAPRQPAKPAHLESPLAKPAPPKPLDNLTDTMCIGNTMGHTRTALANGAPRTVAQPSRRGPQKLQTLRRP